MTNVSQGGLHLIAFPDSKAELTQESLAHAFRRLYELLEEHAPSWYTQEHREMAEIALDRSQGCAGTARTGHCIHRFGGLRVDMRRIEVTLNGELVCLPAREFQLLRYLIERRGTAVSRTELLQAV